MPASTKALTIELLTLDGPGQVRLIPNPNYMLALANSPPDPLTQLVDMWVGPGLTLLLGLAYTPVIMLTHFYGFWFGRR